MRRIALLTALLTAMAVPSSGRAANHAVRPRSSRAADRNGDRIDDDLEQRLGDQSRPVPVIVRFDRRPDVAALRRRGVAVHASWRMIDAAAALATQAQIHALARDPHVVEIEPDRPVHIAMSTARRYEGVDKAVTDFNVNGDGNGNRKSFTNADVVACIVDTGVDASHVDLDQGQVIGWKDYVNARTTPYDDNGHGTHVAGILAGQGDGDWTLRGVAYGAALVAVKALASNGTGSTSTIISAVNFCITNKTKYHIRVLSMSLGSSGSSDGTDALSAAVNAASDAGIVPVVAAGNDGPASGTIGSPAAAAKAITVCSLADPGENGFSISPFSSRGPTADGRIKPDVCAPGTNITSVKAGSSTGYVTYSGTSMATPFVAGVAALMLDANPSLTPAQVKAKLTATAENWVTPGADIETGAGRLQAYEAVEGAGGFTGNGPLVPKHYPTGSQTLRSVNGRDTWRLSVTSTSYPIALTLVVPGTTSTRDFDVYLYAPSGSLMASGTSSARQDTAAYRPTSTGTYTVAVYSYAGTGTYTLDLSYGGSAPVLAADG